MAVISVFVSSTFRDFHKERDILLSEVKGRLDDVVRPLGSRIEIVDLRWGVVDGEELSDEELSRRTLRICLDEIDRSRPLFLGLVGDRYGWVPDEAQTAPVVAEADWSLESAAGWVDPNVGVSCTALEFEYGALRDPDSSPIFFFRDLVGPVPKGWVDEDPSVLAALEDRIRNDISTQVVDYQLVCGESGPLESSLREFEDAVVEALTPLVKQRAIQAQAEADRDPRQIATDLFIQERQLLVGRDSDVAEIVERISRGESVCVLGESGVGKSSVLCAVKNHFDQDPAVKVLFIPAGITQGTRGLFDVIGFLSAQLGVEVPRPETDLLSGGSGGSGFGPDELIAWWKQNLVSQKQTVIIVDALDRLSGEAEDLRWLVSLPENVATLVSTTEADHSRFLSQLPFGRQSHVHSLSVLDGDGAAEMIRSLALAMRRKIPESVCDVFGLQERSPLWVRLAYSQITNLSETDFVSVTDPKEINTLLADSARGLPDSPEELIYEICETTQTRVSFDIGRALALIAVARIGLTPTDLAALLDTTTANIATFRRSMAGLLAAQGPDGELDFTHQIARRAIKERFVEDETELHRTLADHHYQELTTVNDTEEPVLNLSAQLDGLYHQLAAGEPTDRLPKYVQFSDRDSLDLLGNVVIEAAKNWAEETRSVIAKSSHTSETIGFFPYVVSKGVDDLSVDAQNAMASSALDAAARTWERNPNDTRLAWSLAGAYIEMGRGIQRSGGGGGSKKCFLRALEIFDSLVLLEPENKVWSRNLASVCTELGRDARRKSDSASAEEYLARSVAIYERLVASDSKNVELLQNLAVSYRDLGGSVGRSGDLVGSEKYLVRSVEIEELLVSAHPTDTGFAWELARSWRGLGDTAILREDLASAEKYFVRSLEKFEDLVGVNASNTVWVQDYAGLFSRLADVKKRSGDLLSAEKYLRRAIEIDEGLVSSDPSNLDWARNLVVSHHQLGDVVKSRGDFSSAEKIWLHAVELGERLVPLAVASAAFASRLALSCSELGNLMKRRGDWVSAEMWIGRSIEIYKGLAASDPSNMAWVQKLAVSHGQLGGVAEARGDLVDAENHFERSVEFSELLGGLGPSSEPYLWCLAASCSRLGHVVRVRGDLARAEEYVSRAVELRERLVALDASNTGWLSDLAASCVRLGGVAEGRGDLVGAEKYFARSLEVAEGLVGLDPSNTGWLRDVWVSCGMLGEVAEGRGDLVGAEKYFARLLEIGERLVALDTSNTGWLSDVAVSCVRLGGVAEGRGDLVGAEKYFARSLEIRDGLVTLDPSNTLWAHQFADTCGRLADVVFRTGDLERTQSYLTRGVSVATQLNDAEPDNAEFRELLENLQGFWAYVKQQAEGNQG